MRPIHWVIVAVLAAAAVLASVARSDAWDWSPAAAHHQAVVSVRTASGGGESCGSGCYVTLPGGLRGVVTAKHCVGQQCRVLWLDGQETVGKGLGDRTGADCGFVLTEHPSIKPLTIASQEPAVGEWVEFCGYGGGAAGMRLRHWWGRMSGEAGSEHQFANAGVIQGDSGGPIINQRCEVVGAISVGSDQVGNEGGCMVFSRVGFAPFRRFRAFCDRVQTQWGGRCGPGGCRPSPGYGGGCQPYGGQDYGDDGGNYPPSPPINPPMPAPQPPPSPPKQPPTPIAPEEPIKIVIGKVEAGEKPAVTATQQERVVTLDFVIPVGPAGKDGSAGPAGPAPTQEQLAAAIAAVVQAMPDRFRGPAGADGSPGKDAAVDLDQLSAAVAARLPPIYPQWIDSTGKVIDEVPAGVKLGQTLPLRLDAARKAAK